MGIYFNEKEVEGLKQYYLYREKFFELGILVAVVVGFFIGLAIK